MKPERGTEVNKKSNRTGLNIQLVVDLYLHISIHFVSTAILRKAIKMVSAPGENIATTESPKYPHEASAKYI